MWTIIVKPPELWAGGRCKRRRIGGARLSHFAPRKPKMSDVLEKSPVDDNGDDTQQGRAEVVTSTEDDLQMKEIEESVRRLRRQRFQVEQLKQASLEKDTKIEELQAELLLYKQEK